MQIKIFRLTTDQTVYGLEAQVNEFIKDKEIIDIKWSEYEMPPVPPTEEDEEFGFEDHPYNMTFVILYK